MTKTAAAILLLLTASTAQAGTVHKCTDANGKITFSGVACPGQQTSMVQINTKTPPRGENSEWWKTYSPVKRLEKQRRKREAEKRGYALRKAQRNLNRAKGEFNHIVEDYWLTPSETSKPWEHGYCGVPGKAGVVRKQGRFQPKGCDQMPDWYGTIHYK